MWRRTPTPLLLKRAQFHSTQQQQPSFNSALVSIVNPFESLCMIIYHMSHFLPNSQGMHENVPT